LLFWQALVRKHNGQKGGKTFHSLLWCVGRFHWLEDLTTADAGKRCAGLGLSTTPFSKKNRGCNCRKKGRLVADPDQGGGDLGDRYASSMQEFGTRGLGAVTPAGFGEKKSGYYPPRGKSRGDKKRPGWGLGGGKSDST